MGVIFEEGRDFASELIGGKPAKDPKATKAQADIAMALFRESDPLRKALLERSMGFMEGGLDPTATPTYGFLQNLANQQFAQAKGNILETLPAGGALTEALAQADVGRARTLTEGGARLFEDELSRALTLGTGTTQQAMGGLGAAGAVQAQIAQANAARQAAAKQGLGFGLGSLAAGM